MKKNKKMMVTISAFALALTTAGCGTQTNYPEEEVEFTDDKNTNVSDSTDSKSPVNTECKNLELVQGEAYSGNEDEVWYCNDEDDEHFGSFFYPFVAGYVTSSLLSSKHKINVSKYKPGTSKKIVNGKTYNKHYKGPIHSSKKPIQSVKPSKSSGSTSGKGMSSSKSTKSSGTFGSGSSSKSSKSSSSFSSGSSSKGFGSSGFSSGG